MRETDWGKLSLVLMGRVMLSKSLIQFSIDVWGCVPSLLFDPRPIYGGATEYSGLLPKVPGTHCGMQCPQPCSRPPPTHTSTRVSWILMGKSGSVSCGVTTPFSWLLVHTSFFVPSKSLFSQFCGSSVIKSHWSPKSNSLRVLSPFAESPDWDIFCRS